MIFRTIPLAIEADLNSICRGDGFLFVRDGVGVAGRGEVARLNEDTVSEFLASIRQSELACAPLAPCVGPVAFGVVPFLPSSKAEFVVPQLCVSKAVDGSATVTVIADTEDQLTDDAIASALRSAVVLSPPAPTTNRFAVEPRMEVDAYLTAVTAARDAVRRGDISKAVIARDIQVTAADPIDVHAVLLRLRASFGSSYRYCIDGLVGASPELLLSVEGRIVRSHPLAGTAPRTGDPVTDQRLAAELIASTKNQIEHRVVIDMVHDTLLPHCSYLDWEPEPSIVTVANVQHLGTAVEGALSEPVPPVLELVRELCPTPALGGHPSSEAIEFIIRNEPMKRGPYGGAVGWLDSQGNGTFAVTIRCAQFSDDRRHARLFAGGGIVAESDPLAELAETQAKFQAMLSAIVRP